jgi:hypothetical protein
LSDIAEAARTTSRTVEEVLTDLTGLAVPSGTSLDSSERFKIALVASSLGSFERAARALTWQEFEAFGEECLATAGFDTHKSIVFTDDKRRWQVDLTGVKNQILLSIDCKHWGSPNYASKFNKAVEHQKHSLPPLISHMRSRGILDQHDIVALPMIMTLFRPRESFLDDVVLVSVGQFSDFLEHVTPFDPDLPFILGRFIAESSISQDR